MWHKHSSRQEGNDPDSPVVRALDGVWSAGSLSACQTDEGSDDRGGMPRPVLYINRDLEYDWLIAIEYGRVVDGQPDDHLRRVGEDFAYVLDRPGGRTVGFGVGDLTSFDVDPLTELWEGTRFDAPLLGLRDVPAAAIVLAAQARLRDSSTLNRAFFDMAVNARGEEAVALWRRCLEAGDAMAHYGLGYTLLELGRAREGYGHLREYVECCPWNAWAWCWLGRAHEALGELTDARAAYEQAIALDPSEETDAPDLLTALG